MSATLPKDTVLSYFCKGTDMWAKVSDGRDGVYDQPIEIKSVNCGYDEKFSQLMKLLAQIYCEVQTATSDPVVYPEKGIDNPTHYLHYQYQNMINRIMYLVFFVFMPLVWYFMFKDVVAKAGAITYMTIVGMAGMSGLWYIRAVFIDMFATIWDDYLNYLKGRG